MTSKPEKLLRKERERRSDNSIHAIATVIALVIVGGGYLALGRFWDWVTEPNETTYSYVYDRSNPEDRVNFIFRSYYKPPICWDDSPSDLECLNTTLGRLHLPPVHQQVPNLSASVRGAHAGMYAHGRCWQNYAQGPMEIQATSCTDANYDKYTCISQITIRERDTPAFCGWENMVELLPNYPYAD